MQELFLADDLFPALEAGEKALTIRTGQRRIQNGPLTLRAVDEAERTAEVQVVAVQWTTMRAVDLGFLRADGFEDRDDALIGMRRFYPDLTLDSDITVVEWTPLQ